MRLLDPLQNAAWPRRLWLGVADARVFSTAGALALATSTDFGAADEGAVNPDTGIMHLALLLLERRWWRCLLYQIGGAVGLIKI